MTIPTGKFARRRAAGMLVPLVLGCLAAWLHPRFNAQERLTWDARFVRRGARTTTNRVVLVNIDKKTVTHGPWADEPMMLWGPHFASAIRHLKAAGASVVGIDILQRASTESLSRKFGKEISFDQEYAQALNEAGNAILAIIQEGGEWARPTDQLFYANGAWENIGVANFLAGQPSDPDGVVRAFKPSWETDQPGLLFGSFGVRLVEKAVGHTTRFDSARRAAIGDIQVPLHRDGTLLINHTGPPGTLPSCSFIDVAEGRLPKNMDFRGKVVLIGESWAGLQDLHLTPFSHGAQANKQFTPGVEIWGSAVDTLLGRRFLSATEVPAGRGLLLALAVATGIVFLTTRLDAGAVLCLLAMGGWYALAHWLFQTRDHLLLTFTPLCLIPVNYFGVTAYRYFTEEREKRHMKAMWSRYLNPEVVDYLLKHPEEQQLGGKRGEVTVLFSDIRGFTSMSENLAPADVVQKLNEYLTAMTDVVANHGGIVDKFVGDAIMAVWGTPERCPDGPERAVRAAVEMLSTLDDLNRRWESEGRRRLDIGVGVNTGEAVSGNMGSPGKMDFTVIGDTVNVASRLEGLTKELGSRIIIGQATRDALGPEFLVRPLPPAAVKGKGDLLAVYAVDGVRETAGQGTERVEAGR